MAGLIRNPALVESAGVAPAHRTSRIPEGGAVPVGPSHTSRHGARQQTRGWKCGIAQSLLLAALGGSAIASSPPEGGYGLGLTPLPRAVAERLTTPIEFSLTLPTSLDWRDSGVITAIKDQGACGGCWSFAGIACMEAMAVLGGASLSIDLSEQFPLSCDVEEFMGVTNAGCCGGSATVFEFLKNNKSLEEGVLEYGEGSFSCPASAPYASVACPDPYPGNSGWSVATWTLIASDVTTLKTALQDGPVWIGYEVYGDFYDYPTGFWWSAEPNDVYTHSSGTFIGHHAVLLIGYDDNESCWIIKNSWGMTGPSNDDGTCMISYTANCSFNINPTKITVSYDGTPHAVCCLANGTCQLVTQASCASLGGTWHSGWSSCDPNPCAQSEAVCCSGGTCTILTQIQCSDAGGDWLEGYESCDPNPCELHVCCVGVACHLVREDECVDLVGQWHPGYDNCLGVSCLDPLKVCCVGTVCTLTWELDCTGIGGSWYPELTSCGGDPNPCIAMPMKEPTWGGIKGIYRGQDTKLEQGDD